MSATAAGLRGAGPTTRTPLSHALRRGGIGLTGGLLASVALVPIVRLGAPAVALAAS